MGGLISQDKSSEVVGRLRTELEQTKRQVTDLQSTATNLAVCRTRVTQLETGASDYTNKLNACTSWLDPKNDGFYMTRAMVLRKLSQAASNDFPITHPSTRSYWTFQPTDNRVVLSDTFGANTIAFRIENLDANLLSFELKAQLPEDKTTTFRPIGYVTTDASTGWLTIGAPATRWMMATELPNETTQDGIAGFTFWSMVSTSKPPTDALFVETGAVRLRPVAAQFAPTKWTFGIETQPK